MLRVDSLSWECEVGLDSLALICSSYFLVVCFDFFVSWRYWNHCPGIARCICKDLATLLFLLQTRLDMGLFNLTFEGGVKLIGAAAVLVCLYLTRCKRD